MSVHLPDVSKSTLPWVVVIVDDEPDVHDVSQLVLGDLYFDGRPLEILSAYSGAEGQLLFEQRDDIAVALIDVVMEHDRAGLDLVVHVRERLGNRLELCFEDVMCIPTFEDTNMECNPRFSDDRFPDMPA